MTLPLDNHTHATKGFYKDISKPLQY